MKTCTKCNKSKALIEFYTHKYTADKLQPRCKLCARKPAEAQRRHYRKWKLKNKYGITVEHYENLMFEQEGRCLICSSEHEQLDIDHSHVTGKFRGLLCRKCNAGLGLFQDSPELLIKATHYLHSHKKQQ